MESAINTTQLNLGLKNSSYPMQSVHVLYCYYWMDTVATTNPLNCGAIPVDNEASSEVTRVL